MSTATNTYRHYVHDLGILVRDLAIAAKKMKDSALGGEDRTYATARLMALHEVVSLMQAQAAAFQLELKDIGLEGISPERDLV